jgi:high-affinity Fe2+/Pb2+ permease
MTVLCFSRRKNCKRKSCLTKFSHFSKANSFLLCFLAHGQHVVELFRLGIFKGLSDYVRSLITKVRITTLEKLLMRRN